MILDYPSPLETLSDRELDFWEAYQRVSTPTQPIHAKFIPFRFYVPQITSKNKTVSFEV